jgi:hypothetical protein
LLFLLGKKYNAFQSKNLHIDRFQHFLHLCIFSKIFWHYKMTRFEVFEKNGKWLHVAQAIKEVSLSSSRLFQT